MRKRVLAVAVALVLAAGVSAPLILGSGGAVLASWVDADGRAWAYLAKSASWVAIPDIAEAVATEVFLGEALVVGRSGEVRRWPGPGSQSISLVGLADVREVSCGSTHCLARSSDGRLYTWGVAFEPSPVALEGDAVSVSVAGDRALVATEHGTVIEWRLGSEGPLRDVGLRDASLVAATVSAGFAVSRSGEVWAWSDAAAPRRSGDFRARTLARGPRGAFATTIDGRLARLDRAATALPGGADWIGVWASGSVTLALDDHGNVTLFAGDRTEFFSAATLERTKPESESRWAAPVPLAEATLAYVVVGTRLTAADQVLGRRLEGLGFETMYVRDAAAVAENLRGAGLVVVAPSALASRLPRELVGVQAPMLVMDPFALGRMGLVSPGPGSIGFAAGRSAVGIRPEHALGAGTSGRLDVADHSAWLPYAQPSGAVIAAVSEAGLGVAFGWEESRRAGLLLGSSLDQFTESAWTLFDESVRWAVGAMPGVDLESGFEAMGLTGGSGTVLLVVGDLSLSSYDSSLKAWLGLMGFTVQTRLASQATAGDATGKVLVFVSATSPNGDILTKFLNVTVPVLIQTPGIVDDMLMAAYQDRGSDVASTHVTVANPGHPIAHPLSGSLMAASTAGLQNWAIGSSSAQHVFSTNANGDHYALYVYAAGASMVGMNAPSRRVYYGLGPPAANTFTTAGLDLFERMIFWATATNRVPEVDAGPDRSAYHGVGITLQGAVFDDGYPSESSTVVWSQVSGPDTVTFGTPSALTTTATFPVTGDYTLELEANDGSLIARDQVSVRVFAPETNVPPMVDAGSDRVAQTGTAITLQGTASDDALPPASTLHYVWSKTTGPGTVTFGTPAALTTTATFSVPGTYVVRLTVTEKVGSTSHLSAYDELVVSTSSPVLLVVGSTTLAPGDAALKSRFEALGHTVVVQLASATVGNDANGKAFVWLSSTCSNADLLDQNGNAKFLLKGIPVVVQAAGTVDDMGMTGTSSEVRGTATSQSQATITAPTHGLSAGLIGTLTTSAAADYDWGIPAAAAAKIASQVGYSTHSLLFAYEAGATLSNGNPAAARRLFFGPSAPAIASLTATGQRLLDSAVHWLTGVNAAPWVDAGSDQTISLAAGSTTLNGRVVDDGLPLSPGTVTASWEQRSGPMEATLTAPAAAITDATFSAAGDYVFALTAFDGALSQQDLVWIRVVDASSNAPPSIALGSDRRLRLPDTLSLTASVFDDGRPLSPGAVAVSWSKVSGPGNVAFSPASGVDTAVSFSASGSYRLRATADDGVAESADEIAVEVESRSGSALLVVGGTPLSNGDMLAKTRLEDFGFDVTVTTAASAAAATGKALVVISATVNGGAVAGTFANVAAPVLTWEPETYVPMGMASSAGISHLSLEIEMTGLDHALSASLTGTQTVYTGPSSISWGVPAATAIKAATLPGQPTKATVFAYEPGVSMVSGTAPARRVGLFWLPGWANDTANALFDAAVRWVTEPQVSVLLVAGSTTLSAADTALRARLMSRHLVVSTTTASALATGDLAGKALVLVSPTADPVALGTKLRDVSVPVILANRQAYGLAALTATTGDAGATGDSIVMTGSGHALAAGLTGSQAIVSASEALPWGVPGNAAVSIATLSPATPPEGRTIFAYEVGAAMVGLTAPDRRVAFPIGPMSASSLTAAGAKLLDAAIAWALASDRDGDGLGVFDEILNGTDPGNPDTNGDGVLDGVAIATGRCAKSMDADGDGIPNAVELSQGTDPFDWDTDGDGWSDAECFPLDATRTGACAGSVPGDMTPPTITLTKPAATLVSSVP